MKFHIKNNLGFTIIEVVISLSLFIVVLMITSSAFNSVLVKGNLVQRSEESNIEGVIGLVMLRHDLMQAGFGLFTEAVDENGDEMDPVYSEASVNPAKLFNETASKRIPRGLVAGNDTAGILAGTDYIAIKATTVGSSSNLGNSDVSQLYTYVTSSGVPATLDGQEVFKAGDKVIFLDESYSKDKALITRKLIMKNNSDYYVSYVGAPGNNVSIPYLPAANRRFFMRGIDKSNLIAPFNRTDYWVERSAGSVPQHCSPVAGVLYKGVMSHNSGNITPAIPIMDCVANMQVVLGWNTTTTPETSALVDSWSNADGTEQSGDWNNSLSAIILLADSNELRKRLKQVKVYLLVQDGSINPEFVNTANKFPMFDTAIAAVNSEANLVKSPGQTFPGYVDLTAVDMRNYRWKLHKVVVNLRM